MLYIQPLRRRCLPLLQEWQSITSPTSQLILGLHSAPVYSVLPSMVRVAPERVFPSSRVGALTSFVTDGPRLPTHNTLWFDALQRGFAISNLQYQPQQLCRSSAPGLQGEVPQQMRMQ